MKVINEVITEKIERPVKVLQFGEGNFLRAFVDYMIDIMNDETDFNGSIVLVKPIEFGTIEQFEKQNNLYTVYLRGLENGKETIRKRVVTSVDIPTVSTILGDGAESLDKNPKWMEGKYAGIFKWDSSATKFGGALNEG